MGRVLNQVSPAHRAAWRAAEQEFIRRAGSAKYLFGTLLDRQTGATRTHYWREALGVPVPARKDGAARWTRGVDGLTRGKALALARKKGPRVFAQHAHRVQAMTWTPAPLVICRWIEDSDKVREIAVPTVMDRVVLSVLLEVLEPLIDPVLSPAQHGYRATCIEGVRIDVGRLTGVARGSCLVVAHRLYEAVRSGYEHLGEADVRSAFPSVNRSILRRQLIEDGCPPRFARVIIRALGNKTIDTKGGDRKTNIIGGIPLGNPVGPLLFNLHVRQLHDLDLGEVVIVSYADNFFFAAKSKKDLNVALRIFTVRLEEDLLLGQSVKQRWSTSETRPFYVLKGKKDGGWRIVSGQDGQVRLGPPGMGACNPLPHDGRGIDDRRGLDEDLHQGIVVTCPS